MVRLESFAALVFGASSGIGRSVAMAFAEEGARVALVSRNQENLEEAASQIAEKTGAELLILPGDVAVRADVDKAIDETIERFGQLDVLVNSAGTNTAVRRMDELQSDEWTRILDTNLTGALNTTQSPLSYFRQNGGGLIIQVSSVSGRYGDGSGAAYQASKHGVVGVAQATMFEERQNGIRVSVLLPGLVDTPMVMRRPTPPGRDLMDKALQPEDVAAACVFLASLDGRAYVPEMILLPRQLQCIGQTAV